MYDRAGLIEWHLSAGVQGRNSYTYDATQDVAAQWVSMSQPKVGQHSRLVLCDGVAVGHNVSSFSLQERTGSLLMEPSNRGRFVRMREVYRWSSYELFGLPAKEFSDGARAIKPYGLWRG